MDRRRRSHQCGRRQLAVISRTRHPAYRALDVARTAIYAPDLDLLFERWHKHENLQPIGCFKIHAALNATHSPPRERIKDGDYTSSTGNKEQGLARGDHKLKVTCTVLLPDRAPPT